MNDNYLDEDINRKRGRILSVFPIYANILAIASFFFGVTMVNNTNITFILLLIPGFILPVVAFVISIIIRAKYFDKFTVLWFVGFIINIFLFLIYAFNVFIWGFMYFVFSDFSSLIR